MEVKIVETHEELEQAYHVRMVVFVEEQNVPAEEELDEFDKTAIHFIGYEKKQAIAASRLRFTEEYGKLERICVIKEYRGKSFGKELILAMEDVIKEKGYKKAKLNAQTHAEEFYKKLGYETISGEFMDAGIPHVTMIKEL
ncbi:GNAT family N-acetyltransferase [Oceanobacillus halophilus]|uniref:GNAT family N-acetyltransferase n=1 Tax=Oceanobacillus halophilus TaxID=930130 RepID=A0A495A0V1_9BACI|nr:GNAT family N-acetyltransferase [Oceanobacillus halophilus]RKQ32727.1 GNAT family N-acetyltransferase [Oceanobacillus halophilus]